MNDERLYRSRDDRVLTGVAGGLAERLDLDPSLVRVVWAVLAVLSGGILFLVYVVMAFIVPEAPPGYVPPNHRPWRPEGSWPLPASQDAASTQTGQPTGPSVGAYLASEPPPSSAGPDAPTAGGSAAGSTPPPPPWASRADLRAQRRADRRARHDATAPIILGSLLVLVGGWLLVRRFLPSIDTDLLWPVALVVLGVVLLVAAVRPRPEG
jgi:phage shock protein C